jgi:DNA invertase Pin-like site-specific DNA recombinase
MTITPIRGSRTLATMPALPTSYKRRARYDWVAVDLCIDGGCKRGELVWSRLADEDKAEAVRRLNRARLNDIEIADRIGISEQTVFRVRRDNRIPAATARGVNGKALIR